MLIGLWNYQNYHAFRLTKSAPVCISLRKLKMIDTV